LYEDLREFDDEEKQAVQKRKQTAQVEQAVQEEQKVVQETVSSMGKDLECLKTVFSVKPPSQQSGCEEESEIFENTSLKAYDMLKIVFSEVNEVKIELRNIKESITSLQADGVQMTEILDCVQSIKLLLKKKLEKKLSSSLVLPPISQFINQQSEVPSANHTETEEQSVQKKSTTLPLVLPPISQFINQQSDVPPANHTENNDRSLTELISDSISFDPAQYFSAIEHSTWQTQNEQPLISTPEPNDTKIKPKRKHNECACFIRSELIKVYSQTELAEGRVCGSKRKYKTEEIQTKPLSPTRLKLILSQARKKYKLDYDKLNTNEIINSKCRQIKMKCKNNS